MHRTHPILRTLVTVICLAMFASGYSAMAQTTGSATLRGTVKDPSGAIIRGATLTLTNARTKEERKANTGDEGTYVFAALTPGEYSLKVEAPGFKTSELSHVALETSTTRALDITAEVGQPTETVTVTAGVDQLQTETGAKENVITSQQIDNLSIVSRSSIELLRILPGVVAPDAQTLEQVGFLAGANSTAQYHVNGLRGEQNNILIDGAHMIDFGANNGSVITANPDMVQEVKVQTSNYAAEHGTGAVQINATTKGGSRDFHGSVYDYLRNYNFQANDRSNSINGVVRPKSKYNYPGGNVGGPVLLPWTKFNRNRDKLFFFAGFEYYYQRVDEGSSLFTVPSMKMRAGDFSEVTNVFHDNGPDGVSGTADDIPLPGVRVPASCAGSGLTPGDRTLTLAPCLNKLGNVLLNLYPAPNFTDTKGHNYVYSALRPNDRNQFTTRFDYNISDKAKLYVKFAREYEEQGFPRGLWWDSSAYEVPGKLTSSNLGRSLVVNLTNIISSTMTNEVLFTGSKLGLHYDFAEPDKVTYKGLGLTDADKVGFRGQPTSSVCNNCNDVNFIGNNPYVPISIVEGWAGHDFLTAYGYPIQSPYSSFSVTDNLSKVYNTHTLRFGAFIEQGNKNQQSNHDTDIVLAQWGQTNATGTNFGDLYTGNPIEFTQATDRPFDNFRLYNYEFYAQDSWKFRPNVTLEYGLRLGYFPHNEERNGMGVLFDPAAYDKSQGLFLGKDRNTPNGFKLAANGAIPKGVLDNPSLAWMPRLNVAWDIGGKGDWVIRAGAGLFYNRVQGNYDYYSSGQMPNTYSATVDTPWAGPSGGLNFANMGTIDPFALSNFNVSTRDLQSNEIPRTANMSLTIEKRLPGNNILSVAYVGTQGRHLPQQRSINIVPLGTLLNGTLAPTSAHPSDLSIPVNRAAIDAGTVRSFRPFAAYNTIGFYQFTGTSTYHSMQATLSHQSGKNLQYFLTYTFAKGLGTVATNETDGAAWADPIDTRGRSWGILPFDRTHVFNASYNYSFPKLARGSWENGFTDAVLNGWQMSGITTFQSGAPIRLRFSGDITGTGQAIAWYGSDAFNGAGQSVGAITPVYLGNPQTGGNGSVGGKLFDLSKLAIPTFPNSGPSQPPFYLKTPSRSNFDVSFFKNFNFSESMKFQFRAGLFNIFNQAYPTQINNVAGLGGSDIYLTLGTVCKVRKNGVPNGNPNVNGGLVDNICDPTGGFDYTQETKDNFGKIVNKHGRRIVEFAFKFYF
jgi:carboxypeptidase family protein/TonB-dependent receptor-like protein